MNTILILISNTLKVTFRKKGNIILYLFLPLVGIMFSLAVYSGAGSRSINVGYVDKDGSNLAIDFKRAFEASGSYNLSEIDEKDIEQSLLDQRFQAVVKIPQGYAESINKNIPQEIAVVSIKGMDTTIWIENFINLFTRNLMDISLASGGDRTAFDRLYAEYSKNPLKLSEVKLEDERTSKDVTLTSMGLLIMFVMLGAGFTSQFILKEKQSRTYYRICSAPVNSRQFITANILTSLMIVAVQIILIQLAMKYLFRIETFAPDLLLFLVLLLFGMVAIGVGLVVTAFSNSSYMAGTLSQLILTPTCMLGGCFWSLDFMPESMKKIAYFIPQRWAINAVQKLQTGGGLEDILMNMAILMTFTAALLLTAIYKFSRGENVQKFI